VNRASLDLKYKCILGIVFNGIEDLIVGQLSQIEINVALGQKIIYG
jgi:hypothetical protein